VATQGDTGDGGASVRSLPWRVHAASAIGARHVRDGRPNEDAVAHQLTLPPDGSALLVTAVADGHGDGRHFRSDRGSQMAVAAAIAAVQDWSANRPGRPAEIELSAQRDLIPAILARWNAAVAADLTEDQFTAAEDAILTGLALPPVTAYGSTLLVGAFSDHYAVFAQIGDGNIVAVLADGRSVSPVPHDSRLDGTRTTSLCQADAAASFRIGVIQLAARPLFATLLATDGFGNAQAEDRWQPRLAADLAEFGLNHDQGWFASHVPDWAAQCASSAGSGDDTTIALVMNSAVRPSRRLPRAEPDLTRPAVTVPVTPHEPAVLSAPRTVPLDHRRPAPPRDREGDHRRAPEGRRPGRSRRRTLVWIATAVLMLAAGLVLGLLLSGPAAPHRPRPGPSASTTHQPRPSPAPRASTSPSAVVSPPRASTPAGAPTGGPKSPHSSTTRGGQGGARA
jgi:hypothetical protein